MSREHRAAARLAATQALYQMDVAGKGLNEILAEFESHWIGQEVEGEQYIPAELEFFRDIVRGVLADQRSIDAAIDETLNEGWPLRRVEAVMRAVLRAGDYELTRRSDVPARVVIKEYVDVAAAFLDFLMSKDAAQASVDHQMIPLLSTDVTVPDDMATLKTEAAGAAAIGESDGFVPYFDWTSPTMLDTLVQQMQLLYGGKATPDDLVKAVDADRDAFIAQLGQ